MLEAIRHFFRARLDWARKRTYLDELGWYRNLAGGYTQGHMMDVLSRREFAGLTLTELQASIRH